MDGDIARLTVESDKVEISIMDKIRENY